MERISSWLDANTLQTTMGSYQSAFRVYSKWCESEKRTPLPTDPVQLAVYLTWLHSVVPERKTKSYAASSVVKHYAAVRYMHVIGGHADLSKMENFELLLKVFRTVKSQVDSKPKEALLLEDLDLLASVLLEKKKLEEVNKRDDLSVIRAGCAIFLLFMGGFRVGELVSLKWSDLSVTTDSVLNDSLKERMEFKVQTRKNDKRGQTVVISWIERSWNPVKWVLHYKSIVARLHVLGGEVYWEVPYIRVLQHYKERG